VISCDLEPIYEHEGIKSFAKGKTKSGRYHGSMFWNVPGFASKKWVIAARIRVEDSIPPSVTDEDLISGCMEFLNTPPPRKKFQRRVRKPKYGRLELHSAKVIRKDDDMFISALLITEERNSKYFWGKGFVSGR
tara:strand:- start:102 stop:503 length:402 start_codon:yes stop_codon:yes gene_type:complete